MIELLLRIGFSLAIVLGLMWVLAKAARRPLRRHAGATTLTVLGRRQLSRAASVAVVRFGDQALLLGVTDRQVSLLSATDADAMTPHQDEIPERRAAVALGADPTGPDPLTRPGGLRGSLLSPRTWSQTMDFLRERTARR